MKNNSVKFKHFVPKSSTTSVISEFSCDESPMPNAFQYQSFTHAQTISAKLNKSSLYNPQNIMFNTPKCSSVPYNEMMKDEVLSKTPLNKQSNNQSSYINREPYNFSEALIKQSKYTEESMKKITKIERFLDKHKNKQSQHSQILSSEETPKKQQNQCYLNLININNSQQQQFDSKIQRKFNILMDDLRIIRKNIQYFTPFDGAYSRLRQDLNNFLPLYTQNGILINNGTHLSKIELIGDTFKNEKICDIYDQENKFTSYCICDNTFNEDMILTGTDEGNIIGWNYFKNQAYHYYGLNYEYHCNLNQSQPVFMTQQNHNIFIGTSNNQLLILDERMNEQSCLTFNTNNCNRKPYRANSITSPMIPRFGSSLMESPLAKPIDIDLLKETNFQLNEENDEIKDNMEIEKLQFPTFNDLKIEEEQGIKYIDVNEQNVLITLPDGFIHLDIRNPLQEQYSYQSKEFKSLKALFSPGNSDNIVYAKQNSNQCLLWNISKNEVLFYKELQNNPLDIIISKETKEVLILHNDGVHSTIKIYNNSASKLKYCDELMVENFNIQKLLLNSKCECLYGIGPYSLRTWSYYCKNEIEMIQKEMLYQLEI